MGLTDLQKVAITVYYELLIIHRSMHFEYIITEFNTEDEFWNTLKSTNIKFPPLVQ